jgi:restriction system protein
MARRSGFGAAVRAIERDIARQQAAQRRAYAAATREHERAVRAASRAAAADEKERKRLYLEGRIADVEDLNADLAEILQAHEAILAATLKVDDKVEFEVLKQHTKPEPPNPGAAATPEPPPMWDAFALPPLTGLGKMFGGKTKHAAAETAARSQYEAAVTTHQQREASRTQALAEYERKYDQYLAGLAATDAAQHADIDAFAAAFASGDPDAVVTYLDLVLHGSAYPDAFPQHYKLAYTPESRQVVVEYQLPTVEVIPAVKAYKYVRTSDSVTETGAPATAIRGRYLDVIVQTTLRTLHEIFEADDGRNVDVIVFNGIVDSLDPATGKKVKPCLLTVRTTRETFLDLDLAQVDPLACLKHLSASVSKSPTELAPVRPLLEFDMVDKRFVQESDVLGELEQRPNLMEFTPSEFENLITNLFTKMGLEAKQTQASRDGGVDCVAYDNRPIFGGKVVIQAKRYKGTVGVSAVRDLYGTVHNEGASKGILVTTSGYGTASWDFANGKPLELLDGANLLYLLSEHAGIEARIEPPVDWVDPTG